MLLQFTVENFKSFRDPVVLSMQASVGKDLPDNVTMVGNDRCLNTIAIFGANASGKSNIFAALTAAIMVVRTSHMRQFNEPLYGIVPYKFDPAYADRPTSFEFVFTIDEKKYVYGFSATTRKVIKEYLYVFNTAKASTIFERTDVNTDRFTSPALRSELLPLTERNGENKLFLATATSWNCEATRIPYSWFESMISTYSTDFSHIFSQTALFFENDKDDSLRSFTNNLLHEADISIDDYSFESEELSHEQLLQAFPSELKNLVSTFPVTVNKKIRIETIHTIEENGERRQISLPLNEESQGTQSLFLISPVLKRAFETGETLCIDEFSANLHPKLEKYLVSLFNNPQINKAHAQLIISTQSMTLMSLKLLRRDQIYLVEKDRKTGVSELYSLDEFSPRKQENVRASYLLGRYGSVPDIYEEADLWQ